MIGGGLISAGGYGCVFHPELTKDGHPTNDTRYVSKIQAKNFTSDNEKKIGDMVQKIPAYELYFAPILESHNIQIKNISTK